MDAVDKAIRNALGKGDAGDPAFREKVYRSVFAALEKVSIASADVTPEIADRRRKALAGRIRRIEGEFLRAQAEPSDATDEAPADHGELIDSPELPAETAPDIELERRAGEQDQEVPDVVGEANEAPQADDLADEEERVFSAKRRPVVWFFIIALISAMIGMGIWWTRESGILFSPAQRDTSVPNPPKTFSGEDYQPDSGEAPMRQSAGQHRSWINIFNPDDPTTVSASAGASAEISGEGTGKVLRIRSSSTDDAVVFDVGQGVLEQFAGKKAVFDIVASSEEGKPAEISVQCEFGKLGNCIRKRYNVGLTPSDYLFEITFKDAVPDKGGSITIVSDVNGTGLAIDIHEIRVAEEH